MSSMLYLCIILLILETVEAWSGSFGELSRRDLMGVASATASAVGLCLPSCVALAEQSISDSLRLSSGILIPRVGYSLYKTDPSQAAQCVELALQAGVRHFDVATQYGSNSQVGEAFVKCQVPRQELFVTHKVSNEEQSTNRKAVKRRVKDELSKLRIGDSLDMCMVHSPLTSRAKRLNTYQALSELQEEGVVRTIGVCNYGVNPLNEVVNAGLPAPGVIQLVLSPFNQHKDVADWAKQYNAVLSCNAWSKLSSVNGPREGWTVVAGIAKDKGVTKAQILIRWALQSNYLCVPRSASTSKIERQAIQENSYAGVQGFSLSSDEMVILNSLDEKLTAGRLGIVDGWTERDIVNDKWDPTTAV